MANGKVLYKAGIKGSNARTVSLEQVGNKLSLVLTGFGETLVFEAKDGGTSTCRTIVEHTSPGLHVELSLAIPNPRARCRMLPSFLTVEDRGHNIFLDEEEVRKTLGSNPTVRSTVQKILGKIEEEEG